MSRKKRKHPVIHNDYRSFVRPDNVIDLELLVSSDMCFSLQLLR